MPTNRSLLLGDDESMIRLVMQGCAIRLEKYQLVVEATGKEFPRMVESIGDQNGRYVL